MKEEIKKLLLAKFDELTKSVIDKINKDSNDTKDNETQKNNTEETVVNKDVNKEVKINIDEKDMEAVVDKISATITEKVMAQVKAELEKGEVTEEDIKKNIGEMLKQAGVDSTQFEIVVKDTKKGGNIDVEFEKNESDDGDKEYSDVDVKKEWDKLDRKERQSILGSYFKTVLLNK